ncbi:MAG: hypothetical protein ACJA1C_000851 [Crocinitomicaceae bacterium]|jgi:hypothetical protein
MVLYLNVHQQKGTMRNFLIIGLAALAIGCANEKDLITGTPPVETEIQDTVDAVDVSTESTTEGPEDNGKPQRPYQVQGTIGDASSKESDAYDILSARIVGNKLFIEISYSGGCAHHRYECIGSEAISKSLPPQRSIKLIHNNDNDSCESIVKQTIEIDIQPFAYSQAGRSEIVLLLEGFNGQLNYINI